MSNICEIAIKIKDKCVYRDKLHNVDLAQAREAVEKIAKEKYPKSECRVYYFNNRLGGDLIVKT